MNHFLIGIMLCFISYTIHATEKATSSVNYHTIASLGGRCIVALTAEIEAYYNLKNHLTSLESSFPYDFEQYKKYVELKKTILLAKRFCSYDKSTDALLHIYNQACHNRSEIKKTLVFNMLKLNMPNSESEYVKYLQSNIKRALYQLHQTEKSYREHINQLAANDMILRSQLNEEIPLSKLTSEATKRYPEDQYLISFNSNFKSYSRDFSNLTTECEDYAIQIYINNANTDFLGNYIRMIDEKFPEFKSLNNIK